MADAYAGLRPQPITTELRFPEGPVALRDGSVLVTEIRGEQVTRVDPDGGRHLFADTGGGPNGAAFGPDGALYVCNAGCARWAERAWPYSDPDAITLLLPAEHLDADPPSCIQRIDSSTSNATVLYDSCDGRSLGRPNDLVFDSEGGFWFTDTGRPSDRGRDFGAVYYALPDGSSIEERIPRLEMPNGIGLSPDEQTLYVVETRTRRLWACALAGPGRVKSRRGLATVPSGGPLNVGGCDSLCIDAAGNVIIATIGNGGVAVVSPGGEMLAHVPVDDPMTTNACFGGPQRRTLYVTAAATGQLVAFHDWPVPGLPLAYE